MTKKLYSALAMLGLLFTLAVTSVQAQSGDSLQANIRFDFRVGDKVLPAGEYTVRRMSPNTLLIQSADGRERLMAQTWNKIDGSGKATRVKLVFHQYGDQYFLSQVWLNRGGDGRELTPSDAEREAAKAQTLASGDKKPRTVEVVAGGR
ncbi:MAG TPA: hypothetical protein VD861_21360 [Pyrinomonadaceae bacterium]|nr:hypothetical protein [Pyrinomonadaceae bacterium]